MPHHVHVVVTAAIAAAPHAPLAAAAVAPLDAVAATPLEAIAAHVLAAVAGAAPDAAAVRVNSSKTMAPSLPA